MTDTRCAAVWTDDRDHRNNQQIQCRLEDGHDGPHRNEPAGVSWGGPARWFGEDEVA